MFAVIAKPSDSKDAECLEARASVTYLGVLFFKIALPGRQHCVTSCMVRCYGNGGYLHTSGQVYVYTVCFVWLCHVVGMLKALELCQYVGVFITTR
jgi:hypothetical protein